MLGNTKNIWNWKFRHFENLPLLSTNPLFRQDALIWFQILKNKKKLYILHIHKVSNEYHENHQKVHIDLRKFWNFFLIFRNKKAQDVCQGWLPICRYDNEKGTLYIMNCFLVNLNEKYIQYGNIETEYITSKFDIIDPSFQIEKIFQLWKVIYTIFTSYGNILVVIHAYIYLYKISAFKVSEVS